MLTGEPARVHGGGECYNGWLAALSLSRGKKSLETICLILAYKVKYPNDVFLLRGNHECASINRHVPSDSVHTLSVCVV